MKKLILTFLLLTFYFLLDPCFAQTWTPVDNTISTYNKKSQHLNDDSSQVADNVYIVNLDTLLSLLSPITIKKFTSDTLTAYVDTLSRLLISDTSNTMKDVFPNRYTLQIITSDTIEVSKSVSFPVKDTKVLYPGDTWDTDDGTFIDTDNFPNWYIRRKVIAGAIGTPFVEYEAGGN